MQSLLQFKFDCENIQRIGERCPNHYRIELRPDAGESLLCSLSLYHVHLPLSPSRSCTRGNLNAAFLSCYIFISHFRAFSVDRSPAQLNGSVRFTFVMQKDVKSIGQSCIHTTQIDIHIHIQSRVEM